MNNLMTVMLTVAFLLQAIAGAGAAADGSDSDEGPEPSISDVMVQQQMRHIKLWFAGQGGNWPLADYEVGKLNDGFADLKKLLGGDTVQQAVDAPLKAIENAIAAKDRAAFGRGYDALTAGCNGCHRLLDHAFISIQRPTSQPYSNQSFQPQR